MIQKYIAVMRRTFPTLRLKNVIRLCAVMLALCSVIKTDTVLAQTAPVFVHATHVGGNDTLRINLCASSTTPRVRLDTLLAVRDPDAGELITYSYDLAFGMYGGGGYLSPGTLPFSMATVADTAYATGTSGAGLYFNATSFVSAVRYFRIGIEDQTGNVDVAVVVVTVDPSPTPVTGSISGAFNEVRSGSSITLSQSLGRAGTWSSSAPSIASVTGTTSSATVTGGSLSGASSGSAIISYSISGACGVGVATYNVTTLTTSAPSTTALSSSTAVGLQGSPFTITGTGFDATPANNIVYFGALRATVTSASTTSLTVTIPKGATYSKITVLNNITHLVANTNINFTPMYDSSATISSTLYNFAKPDSFILRGGAGAGAAGTKPYSVEIADVNNDGMSDLLVVGTGRDSVYIYQGIGGVNSLRRSYSSTPMVFACGTSPINVKAADLDLDGMPEVIVTNSGSSRVSILRNTSSGSTISFAPLMFVSVGALPTEMALGDFNNDGKTDIAVVTAGAYNTVAGINLPGKFNMITNLYERGSDPLSTSSFRVDNVFTYRDSDRDNPLSICAGDIDGDSKLDVAITDHKNRNFTIYKNASTATSTVFVPGTPISTAPTGAAFAGTEGVAAGTSAGRTYDYSLYLTGYPNQIRMGDVVGADGKPEIIVAVSDSDLLTDNHYNMLTVYKNNSISGTISMSLEDTIPTAEAPVGLALADLNGDRKLDVVVTNAGDGSVTIIKNTTSGGAFSHTAQKIRLFSTAVGSFSTRDIGPVCVNVGDLNQNAAQDIAVVSREGNTLSLLRGIPAADTTPIRGNAAPCLSTNDTLIESHRVGSNVHWMTTGHHTSIISAPSGAGDTMAVFNTLSAGTDTITAAVYVLRDDTTYVTKIINVIPAANAGVVSGTSASGVDTVCVGGNITLTSTVSGGAWSSVNGAIAAVGATTGIVSGISFGLDTIVYTVTNVCGTDTAQHRVFVNTAPSPGDITGADTMCLGGTAVTLSETATGGTWSSSAPSIATVSSTGVVSSVSAGTANIFYTVPGSTCGSAVDTLRFTVYGLPSAGTVSGLDSICQGVTTTYSSTVSGGNWSSASTAVTVTAGTGSILGNTVGAPTVAAINYRVTDIHTCVSNPSTKNIVVSPLPTAAVLSGATSVCVNSTASVTAAPATGNWSTTDGLLATISASGIITGVSAGTAVMSYTITSPFGCAPAVATRNITVNGLPTPNITATSFTLCTNTSRTFTGSLGTGTPAAAGTWRLSNPVNATITSTTTTGYPANAVVAATAAGIDTLFFTATNTCGFKDTFKLLTINASADTGIITGPSLLCIGGGPGFFTTTATLVSGAPGWSSGSLGVATIDATTGVATAVGGGFATISFTNSSASCGNLTATRTLVVPSAADPGVISALNGTSICPGTLDTLVTTSSSIGTNRWRSDDVTKAIVVFTTGVGDRAVIQGVSAGTVTIWNIDSTTSCGSDSSSFTLTILPSIPSPGTIAGTDTACFGDVIKVSDTEPGGVWSVTGGTFTTVSTDTIAISGSPIGTTRVLYITSNICGRDTATFNIKVNGIPHLNSPLTANVCDSILFSYTPSSDSNTHTSVLTYTWDRLGGVVGIANPANSGVGTINEYLDNTTNASHVVNYTYVTSLHGCSSTATVAVTVKPTPYLISHLFDTVCSGSPYAYLDTISTGATTSANWTRPAVSGIGNPTATGVHAINEILIDTTLLRKTVVYNYVLNLAGCVSNANVTVTVDPRPTTPRITTHAPGSVCTQTMFQNFGSDAPPPAGVNYTWTASGAEVWATGTTRQYSLVNFTRAGGAWVYLEARLPGYTCAAKDSFGVVVATPVSDMPEVIYFNGDFVCLSNTQDSYQWGIDDKATLDSSLLMNQTNQNYTNTNPDFTHNYYFVMTKHGDCFQKTYYNIPTGVTNVTGNMGDVTVYPNPATNNVNVEVANTTGGDYKVELINMLGQKISTQEMVGHKTNLNIADLSAGVYFVECYRDGVKFATAKFVKN